MGHVAVTLNRRTYRLECEDGQEPRLLGLAAHLRSKLDGLTAQFGQVGDDRLMLLAALQIADELWEARDQLAIVAAGQSTAPEAPLAPAAPPPPAAASPSPSPIPASRRALK